MTLRIRCVRHPRNKGLQRPHTDCGACRLLYIFRYQHTKIAEQKLGGLNPYQFLPRGLEGAFERLKITSS